MGANSQDEEKNRPQSIPTTHISGTIMGPVHTGSGDVIVHDFHASSSSTISTKDDLLSALREFKLELDVASRQGLSKSSANSSAVAIREATQEASKANPDPTRIIERLNTAKKLITAGTEVATIAAISTDKLIPLLENIIHSIGKIFNIS